MVKITGQKAHKARLKRIRGAAMRAEVGKAIYVAADMLKVEAQVSITTGAVSGKGHVVSAPGQPPNNDTGVLAAHIETKRVGSLAAEVTSNATASSTSGVDSTGKKFGKGRDAGASGASIAVALEFGTSRMAARPYMQPAAAKTRPKAQRLVQEAVKRVSRGGTL